MTPQAFWSTLDEGLRALDAAGLPALGPADLRGGIEDCLSCSVATLESQGVGGGPFVFYHSQDLNPARGECYLAWSGETTPARVAAELTARGLRVTPPADASERILVTRS